MPGTETNESQSRDESESESENGINNSRGLEWASILASNTTWLFAGGGRRRTGCQYNAMHGRCPSHDGTATLFGSTRGQKDAMNYGL